MTNSLSLPAEIVQRICEIVYLDSVPLCSLRLLDPASIPSAAHDGQAVSTSIYETQHVLYMLCLVNRTFYRYAQPLICRRIQFTLPYRFMLLVQAAIDKKVSTLSSIRLLDFSSFRALGLGRTVGESTEHPVLAGQGALPAGTHTLTTWDHTPSPARASGCAVPPTAAGFYTSPAV